MRRSLTATVAAAAVLVGGANLTSYAATGKPLLLGTANKAAGTTVLKNTGAGPALSLKTRSRSTPPLKVSSSAKVANLNADRVDGLEASSLRTRAYKFHGYAETETTRFDVKLPLPVGSWSLAYDVNISDGGYQSPIECYLYETKALSTQEVVGRERFVTSLNYQLSLSGAGVSQRSASSELRLACQSTANFTASFNVSAIRVDDVLADKELAPIQPN